MRKVIKLFLVLITLLIVVSVAVPFLVPLDTYKQKIIAQVKASTGRDLIIAGNIKASVFPALGVELEKATLSSPEGYVSKDMIQVEQLTLEVDLIALLHKQLQVKRFILVKPVINLEVNDAGKPNWEFSTSTSTNAPQVNTHVQEPEEKKTAALLSGLMLGDVKISDGEINYRDVKSKQVMALTAVNVKATLPSLSQPFNADAEAVWNGEKLAVKVSLAEPSQFIAGNSSASAFDIKGTPVRLHYEGKATPATVSGTIALTVPSLPKLAKWTGGSFEWKGTTPLAFAINGGLECSAVACVLSNSDITLDNIKLKGNVKVSRSSKIPNIETTLTTETIDFSPYLSKQQADASWFISPAMAMEWSSEHIDLSGLQAANATINLATGNVVYNKIKLGKTLLNLQLSNGLLNIAIPEAALYGGNAKVNSTLNANGAFTKRFTLTNVQAEPFLTDATGQDRVSGKLNMGVNLKGQLTSQRDLINSLDGNGNIQVTDGAIKGIDFVGMVRNVESAFKNTDKTQQKTDFSELGGTFTITHGIITNNDLAMKAPLLRISGHGTVNLPLDAINYRLTPMVVQTMQGQGGKDKQGLEVPIIVDGSLENPHFSPDIAGMAQKALENPDALKNSVNSVKEQLKNNTGGMKNLKGLLKGFQHPNQ